MITRRNGFALVAAALFPVAAAVDARAQSTTALIMFEEPGCPWCRRWHAEVGIGHPKSKEGQRAPLRQILLQDQRRCGVTLSAPVTVSPTLLDGLLANIDKAADRDQPGRRAALQTTFLVHWLPLFGERA